MCVWQGIVLEKRLRLFVKCVNNERPSKAKQTLYCALIKEKSSQWHILRLSKDSKPQFITAFVSFNCK